MQFETIGRVSVGDLRLKVGRQVNDVDGCEWTFLYADTTSYAQAFRDEGNLGLGGNLDTQLASAYDRTRLLALLATFLRLDQLLFHLVMGGSSHLWLALNNTWLAYGSHFSRNSAFSYLVIVDNSNSMVYVLAARGISSINILTPCQLVRHCCCLFD